MHGWSVTKYNNGVLLGSERQCFYTFAYILKSLAKETNDAIRNLPQFCYNSLHTALLSWKPENRSTRWQRDLLQSSLELTETRDLSISIPARTAQIVNWISFA